MLAALMKFKDRELIEKCGLDAYFFLRYLKTLLVIFIPIATVVIPILLPVNYIGGKGQGLTNNSTDNLTVNDPGFVPSGLDTLAWGNVSPSKTGRYWAHLILAICVIVWVCAVFFFELRVYIKVRQDYLTSAEHRLRASATTVLVNSIPNKWLSEEALRGLFDVFPGGIRNIWLTRDLSKLLEKIHLRDAVHLKLEAAETEVIKLAKKKQLKRRVAEEKKARKQAHAKGPTKKEREARDKQEDAEAQKRAEGGEGVSSGDHDDVPHDVQQGVEESREEQHDRKENDGREVGEQDDDLKGIRKIPIFGTGIAKIGDGLLGGVGRAGQTFKALGQGVDNTLETTNGFTALGSSRRDENATTPSPRGSDRPRRVQILADNDNDDRPDTATGSETGKSNHSRTVSAVSQDDKKRSYEPAPNFGNTVRKLSNLEDMYIRQETRFWEFWKPPAGGYASPIPQGVEGDEFPFNKKTKSDENKTGWEKFKAVLPFMGGDEEEEVEYPSYKDPEYREDTEGGAEWEKWIKKSDRPTHRLANFSWTPNWLPGLPLINKKVDTIYWCRGELARLNMEIEEDQKHPERYPLMRSAFIQFNHQVAAHMACQSLIHHVPKHMAPRMNEISPNDVIWDNMAIQWWEEWLRTAAVMFIIAAMVLLWAIPVAFTASLGQLDSLINQYSWLQFLQRNDSVYKIAGAIAGVLPAILLALLLVLVPIVLDILAGLKGSKTGAQKAEFVQIFFFVFLFVQVFLVVSISSFFASSIGQLVKNFQSLTNIDNVLNLLAVNLPKAANYFFSYMLLQAMSVSSGTLLQIGALAIWYIIAKMFDTTARNKWARNTTLSKITWGSFFPVYTNFACIALVYCVVAPLISIFAIITFGLLWIAQRYSMLYVTRFDNDTGGVLYPRAINQTFTGLYVMELCLAGLFLIVRDENGNAACTTQGVIILVVGVLTIGYQILLNMSFAPLFRYLPITFEDEAVLRDEAFQRAQDRRMGLIEDDEEEGNSEDDFKNSAAIAGSSSKDSEFEMQKLQQSAGSRQHRSGRGKFSLNPVRTVGTWAKRETHQLSKMTFGKGTSNVKNAAAYRQQQRQKDLEAQRAIGEALYGGYHDDIEDLTPEERDMLVRHAFQHYALRSRRPTVWVPRDDIGVSDDEIRRTREFSEYIWISNEGTALDSKVRVVYGRNPPDFSEVDLISL
jgi:calcium permeable stress-gated cation channel